MSSLSVSHRDATCPDNDCSPRTVYNPARGRFELSVVRFDPDTGRLGWWDYEYQQRNPDTVDADGTINVYTDLVRVWRSGAPGVFGIDLGRGQLHRSNPEVFSTTVDVGRDDVPAIMLELRKNQLSRCDGLRRRIEGGAKELERLFNNYNPATDGSPHPWSHAGRSGMTQPGGHYRAFNQGQDALRRNIAEYNRDCKGKDGSGFDPSPHEKWVNMELIEPYPPPQRFMHNLRGIWDGIRDAQRGIERERRRNPYMPPPFLPLPGRVPRF